jgi:ribosomal protein S18 acetylase RimI-like enzyme
MGAPVDSESVAAVIANEITLRPARQDDAAALWDFLAMAAYEPDAAAARAVPVVAEYLIDWQRPTDFGVIAERHARPVGAAWARFFPIEMERFYFDERTFDLTVGVHAEARGLGVGERLIRALIAEATLRGLRLSLNVRATNPARRLYERLGFQYAIGQLAINRTGGITLGMVHDEAPLTPPAPDAGGGA